ncbi:MAG: class I SAM-dependent methyltransferase [Actinomycetota bacterium]
MADATPTPDQYDLFADEFAAHAEVAPYNALYDRPVMLDLIGDIDGREVLDAGCGPGIYAAELLGRGAAVQACDASPRMVELATERTAGAAAVRVHALDEPFTWLADQSVDVAVCALVLHYLNDRPAFLAEMRRVLRPDGRLVISTHHPTGDWYRLGGSYFTREVLTETWSKGWQVTTWRLPLTDLCEEFATAGFVIERLVEAEPDPRMVDTHPKDHARLSTVPGFVFFRLVPAPQTGPRTGP